MIYGGAAVIENTHGEHRVEGTYLVGNLVEGGGENVDRNFRHVALDALKLHGVGKLGVDTDCQSRTCPCHTEALIAIAAADIQDRASGQWRKMRQQTLPFPVRPPLRIDVHAEQFIGALAPGHQVAQGRLESLTLRLAAVVAAAYADAGLQVDTSRHKIGQ